MFRQTWQIVLAVAVVICATGLGGYVSGFNQGQHSRDQQVTSLQRLADLWRKIRDADNTKWSVSRAMEQQMQMKEFQAKIGQVTSVDPTQLPVNDKNMTHIFKDEATGRIFYLRFADNRLVGFHSGYGFAEAGEFLDLERNAPYPRTTTH
jgi:hypothetical protein